MQSLEGDIQPSLRYVQAALLAPAQFGATQPTRLTTHDDGKRVRPIQQFGRKRVLQDARACGHAGKPTQSAVYCSKRGSTHLHCSVPTIGDAALISHAVAGGDALCRNFTNVLGRAWFFAEWKVHRRLGTSNCTSRSPSVGPSLLDDDLLWTCKVHVQLASRLNGREGVLHTGNGWLQEHTVSPVSGSRCLRRRRSTDATHAASCNTCHRASEEPSSAAFAAGRGIVSQLLQDLGLLARHVLQAICSLTPGSLYPC